MKKLLRENEYFELLYSRHRNPTKRGKGHPSYTIKCKWWAFTDEEEEQVRNVVDPNRSIGGRKATSWTFKRLEDAEKHYTMLVLKWA